MQSQKLGVTPSSILGLKRGSFRAYCFDEALWYLGTTIEHEMEKASHKPSKGERQAHSARQRVLDKFLGDKEEGGQKFADPALLFQ